MAEIKAEPNPLGVVHSLDAIEEKLVQLATKWDEEVGGEEKKFWQVWKWGRKVSLSKVTNFLLLALDELIQIVDGLLEDGPDKKATVLDAVDRLYEYVIKEAMPFWLKPFASQVKNYIIYTLVSNAIDWIVDKYRNGAWRDKIKPESE